MRYFRSYPVALQILLFGAMIFTMTWFGTFLVLSFLPRLSGYTAVQITAITEQSPRALVNAALVVQGLLSAFIFLVPALVFAHLTTPRPAEYLGLRAPGKPVQLLLVVLLMLGAIPVLQVVENLIGQINFGAKIKAQQEASDTMMKAFLTQPDAVSFIRAFIVMAILPGIGEELFFRGVLLRFAKKHSRSMAAPIIVTALIFALVHTNVYGLVSIFTAGVLLAVIYYLTGSLWCSILAHMTFNGSQVILTYLAGSNGMVKAFETSEHIPVMYVISGAVIFVASLYLLIKNKTPLPANWTDDFTPAELSQNAR